MKGLLFLSSNELHCGKQTNYESVLPYEYECLIAVCYLTKSSLSPAKENKTLFWYA